MRQSFTRTYGMAWLVFAIAFLARAAYFSAVGFTLTSDSVFYINAAAIVSQSHFHLLALARHGYPFFYWLYPTFLALFNSNYAAVVVAQVVLQSVAAVLIFLLASRLFNTTAGVLAGFGYALFWEVFQWDLYILTDSLFVFAIILAAFVGWLALEKRRLLYWLLFAACTLAIMFLRPTMFPLLAAVGLLAAWRYHWKYKVATVAVAVVALGWISARILSGAAGPDFGLTPYVRYFASMFEHGILVHDRSSLTLDVQWMPGLTAQNIITFLKMFVAKLALYWLPIVPEFSLGHKLINLLTFIPLIGFGAVGIVNAFRDRSDPAKHRFYTFMLATIVLFWVFQALTEIDYDWRYRLPVLPFVLMFASFGFSLVLAKIKTYKSL